MFKGMWVVERETKYSGYLPARLIYRPYKLIPRSSRRSNLAVSLRCVSDASTPARRRIAVCESGERRRGLVEGVGGVGWGGVGLEFLRWRGGSWRGGGGRSAYII